MSLILMIFQKNFSLILITLLAFTLFSPIIHALPSFSRQTGEACTSCHIQTLGANLTPRGRDFKLKGYTQSIDNKSGKLPLSMIVRGGGDFDLRDTSDFFSNNRNTDVGYVNGSVFYAGKVYKNLGAYVQGTGAYNTLSDTATGYLNKVDLRFANQVDLSGYHIDYGISVNNEPGVQDLWNTNAVWRNSIGGGSTLSDRRLSGRVVGASFYTMINNLLYIEAGGYTSLPVDVQQGIGRANFTATEIDGGTPYWRIALQHNWNGHYMALGHFGLRSDVKTNFLSSIPLQNNYTSYSDLGVDATYQYLANPDHIFELKASYVRETRSGLSNTTIETINANAAYTWQQTLGLMLGYQYNTSGHYLATELSYTPFGKPQSLAAPWLNLRLNLGYLTELADSYPQDRLYLGAQIAF